MLTVASADYASSKSALQYGFTLSLKNEIVKHHPLGRVNTVAPGWIMTAMAEQSLQNPDTKYAALASTSVLGNMFAYDIAYIQ